MLSLLFIQNDVAASWGAGGPVIQGHHRFYLSNIFSSSVFIVERFTVLWENHNNYQNMYIEI